MRGSLAEREVVIVRQSNFLAAPDRGEPKLEQIMARTAQKLQTGEYFERNVVTVGKTSRRAESASAVDGQEQNDSDTRGILLRPAILGPRC
eukprot:6864903-Pyramimonas_sp.AAC.1